MSKRYRVVLNRTEYQQAVVFVTADDIDQASERAQEEVGYNFDAWDVLDADTDVTVRPLGKGHEIKPIIIGDDDPICEACEQRVVWTGVHSSVSPTGRTIPGPWKHYEEVMNGNDVHAHER